MKILIGSTTLAEVSSVVQINQSGLDPSVPVSVWCWGLTDAEEIEIQLPTDKDSPDNWVTVYKLKAGAPLNQTAVYSPCKFRVKKGSTSTAAGVAIASIRGIK